MVWARRVEKGGGVGRSCEGQAVPVLLAVQKVLWVHAKLVIRYGRVGQQTLL